MATPIRRKSDNQDKPTPEVPRSPKPWHLPSLATLSSEIRVLFINLCLLGVVLLMVPVIALQFTRSRVILDTISVPPALVARGLTAEVAANRLWDGLHDVEVLAASSKEGITAIPKSQRVDFAIPDSGISIDSLVHYVRQFFGAYQTRVTGEFRCADPDCAPTGMSLRLRILREQLYIIQMPPIGSQSEADYFQAAALRVLAVLDPYKAAAAQIDSNPQVALATAERLVQSRNPDAIWAYNLIGNWKSRQGDLDGAIAAFQGALNLDPSFVVAQTNLGTALVGKGDYPGAAKVFDAVAAKAPNDRFLALGRYRLALSQGNTDEAIKFALQADQIDPGTPRYLFLAAKAAFDAGRFPEATQYATRALDGAPDDYACVFLLSAIYESNGEVDKVATLLRRALALSPDQPDFLGLMADVLVQTKAYDEAVKVAGKALALSPDAVAVQIAKSTALQALNRQPEALAQLATAAKLDPQNPEIALMQGEGYEALNRPDQARLAYQRAITSGQNGAYGMIAKMRMDGLAVLK